MYSLAIVFMDKFVNLENGTSRINLLRLAEKCQIELNEEQRFFFITVTAFNINSRYDDYKSSFKLKCTPEFTADWIEKLKDNREWIKKLII
jgi:hypothetical protein